MFFSGKSLFAKLCFKLSSIFFYKNGKKYFYSGDTFLILWCFQYLCLTLVKTCSKAEKAAFPGKLISTFISSLTIYEMSTALRTVQLLGKNKQESLLFLYVRRESRVLALTWFSAATSISKQIANNSMQLTWWGSLQLYPAQCNNMEHNWMKYERSIFLYSHVEALIYS